MTFDVKTLDQIASELQGYDPHALSADSVLAFLRKLVTPVQDAADLPLFEALGRVLATDVISPFDVPPHDNSAMDGYAFDGSRLKADAPLELKMTGATARALRFADGIVSDHCSCS